MHIGIIQGAFFPVPPVRGGAVEKLWHALAQEFAQRGHQVTHVSRTFPGLPERAQIGGVQQVRVRGYDQPANGLWLKWRDLQYSLRAVRALPPTDVTVTNTFWSPLLLRRRRGTYVCVERMPKGQMRLYRSAARLHACSSAVREAILAEDPSAAARTIVIPNPLPTRPNRAVDWSRKQKTILFVGRLHPEKGIELLLAAFSRARDRGALADWKLVLVGPSEAGAGGGGRAWLESLQRTYARADIEWRAPIYDAAKLDEFYESAWVFAYPSVAEKGETFGVAVLEAMAWGAVPVVSALACFRDFVTPGRNGFVFDHRASDAVERLDRALTDAVSADLPALGSTATQVRASHDVANIASAFLNDFSSVLA